MIKAFIPLHFVPPLRPASIMVRRLSFINKKKKTTFWYPNFIMLESMSLIWCLSCAFFFSNTKTTLYQKECIGHVTWIYFLGSHSFIHSFINPFIQAWGGSRAFTRNSGSKAKNFTLHRTPVHPCTRSFRHTGNLVQPFHLLACFRTVKRNQRRHGDQEKAQEPRSSNATCYKYIQYI